MVSFFSKIGNAWRRLSLVAAMGALAACDPSLTDLGGSSFGSNATEPVDVALLVPAGSGVGELDVIAQSLERAARLAMEDIEGVEVNLTVYNTQRSTGTAVNAATEAVAAGADIILGPLDGEAAAAVGLAVSGAGEVMWQVRMAGQIVSDWLVQTVDTGR